MAAVPKARRKAAPVVLARIHVTVAALFGLAACAVLPQRVSDVAVGSLTLENRISPLGIDAPAPRFGWKLLSSQRDAKQSAYRIRVAFSAQALMQDQADVWDSGKVRSDDSVLRPYGGPAMQSMRRYFWQLRVWDSHGAASTWSQPQAWEMGLLSPADWHARWIESTVPERDDADNPSPLLRKGFSVKGPLRSARAYVTSHGLYRLYINGARANADLFTPGWTSYGQRLQYQTYDLTEQIKAGDNAIGAMLGDGWYRGILGETRNHYGRNLGLLLQLHLVYEDGREEDVISDASWSASTGAVLASSIYNGERYDARLEKAGWSGPSYDASAWAAVRATDDGTDTLVADSGAVARRHEELRAVRVFRTPKGEAVADFGQNLVGWVRFKVRGAAGTTIRLRHAEVLDAQGNFYTENLRSAAQLNEYTLRGGGEETYEPRFSYQGFRYVSIEGWPGTPNADDLTAVAVYADMPQTGEFAASDPLLNQLQHNIAWSQRGNFLAVPTDCPQRNERLGWTGDAQVFFPTAAFNMDVSNFFRNWLANLTVDQLPDGSIPWVSPDVLHKLGPVTAAGAAGWGDAATVIPWNFYLAYGDAGLLARQYPSMQRWLAYEQSQAGDNLIWSEDLQFGDWLDYGADKRENHGATSEDLIATAYFAHSADLLARSAAALGKSEDAARYQKLFGDVRVAFQKKFVDEAGKVGEGTQTAYVLALDFKLLPDAQRAPTADALAAAVRESGHLTTGFLGTPRLLWVLSQSGHPDEAYALLKREDFPGWLYPIKHGATTIWERWDGIKPDGTFEDKGMNSFNHYAYGAVGDWLYRSVAGLDYDDTVPGERRLLIQPHFGGGLTGASAAHETPYGRAASAWTLDANTVNLRVSVPPNTTAQARLPGAQAGSVRETGVALKDAAGVHAIRQDGADLVLELGSGSYRFSYPR